MEGELRLAFFFGTPRMNAVLEELCRKHGFSETSYYLCRSKFGGRDVSDAKLKRIYWSKRCPRTK